MKQMRKTFTVALYRLPMMASLMAVLLLGVSGLAWADSSCDALSVANAWVRAAPNGAPVMGGYMQVTNDGDGAVALTAVSSAQFERVQMHESTVDDNGMASMQPVAEVTIPAGGMVAFAPGGYHLMLFDPQQTLSAGDDVKLTLHCGDSDTTAVTATVRNMLPEGKKAMQHMHHGD